MATQINLGIFAIDNNRVEIRIKPDYNILATDIISEIKYTIRWSASQTVDIIPEPPIAPFYLEKQGNPVLYSGYYYQTFIAIIGVPFRFIINAGEEVVIARFKCTSRTISTIYLINNTYTNRNNLSYYFEINGINRTGIFYSSYIKTVASKIKLILEFLT